MKVEVPVLGSLSLMIRSNTELFLSRYARKHEAHQPWVKKKKKKKKKKKRRKKKKKKKKKKIRKEKRRENRK